MAIRKETDVSKMTLAIVPIHGQECHENDLGTLKVVKWYVTLFFGSFIAMIFFSIFLLIGSYLCGDDNRPTCALLAQPVKMSLHVFNDTNLLHTNMLDKKSENSSYHLLAKLTHFTVILSIQKDTDTQAFNVYFIIALLGLFTFLVVGLRVLAITSIHHEKEGEKLNQRKILYIDTALGDGTKPDNRDTITQVEIFSEEKNSNYIPVIIQDAKSPQEEF